MNPKLLHPTRFALLLCGALAGSSSALSAQNIWRVAQNIPSSGPWATAFSTLDAALNAAAISPGTDVILVARGTYEPQTLTIPGNPRSATFSIPSGTSIQGGWNSVTDTPPPVGVASGTVLSGALSSGRALHVVTIPLFSDPLDPGVFLSNLTVRGGNANDPTSNDLDGGGIHCDGSLLQLDTVTVDSNTASQHGAGLYFAGLVLRTKFCRFTDNLAGSGGGGIYSRGDLFCFNSTFLRNEATYGGGIYADKPVLPTASRRVIGCRFKHNAAAVAGGGLAFDGLPAGGGSSNFFVSSCTLSENLAGTTSGAIHAAPGLTTSRWVITSILWQNSAPADPELPAGISVDYSVVDTGGTGPYPGTIASNSDLDPLLATNQSLSSMLSSAYDQVNPFYLAADLVDVDGDGDTSEPLPLDIARNPRVNGAFLDLGAYEL